MKKYLSLILVLTLATVLRVFALGSYPSGLNADEASIGYNAYSLLQTGKDEHGVSWPLVFRSFDDYKPAVYFYLVLPFVKFIGLDIWAVRLPSALLGVASVYLLYLIVSSLTKNKQLLAIISAFILATSPWHIHFSRGGWEVNASLFFILLGVYGFIKGLENARYFYIFALSLAVSLYTYHSARLISPLLAISLLVIYRKPFTAQATKKLSVVIVSFFLGIIVSIPLISQMLSKEGQSRFSGVSVFSDPGPLWQALEVRREHPDGLYNRAIHNQYITYGLRFTKNYLSHFSPRFLFFSGDEIARSKVPETGQSLYLLFPFFLLGLFSILKFNREWKIFFFFWLAISPIAAALTFQSPHALRSQNMVVPLSLVISLGILKFLKTISKLKPLIRNIVLGLFCSLYLYLLSFYLHNYYIHYPKELPFAWQYGFDHIAEYVKQNGQNYQKIIITDRYDQPYILMAFYLKYPPEQMQSEIVMTPRDKFGFSTVRNFDKFEFKSINWSEDKNSQNTLIISADEAVDDKFVIDTIKDPAGNNMYKILSTNGKQ
jgi:4-amino-4-deoxy-L-arabinose transferase-like glycosyltransferase